MIRFTPSVSCRELLFGFCFLLSSCGAPAPEAGADRGSEYLPPPTELRASTDPVIAENNLDAQLTSMDRQLALSSDLETRARLFDLLSLRVQMFGRFSDLWKLQALVRFDATDPGEMILRARFHLAVHDFDRAQETLGAITSMCDRAPGDSACANVWQHERTLDVARHVRLEFWLEVSEERAQQTPTYESLFALATVEWSLGMYESADQSFAQALARYEDVSPFVLAGGAFQRGVMWSESAGRPDLGKRFYREALHYLPRYIVANVHLAELTDDTSVARHLLEIASETEDPEPWGKLGDLLVASEPVASREWIERADQAYRELLAAFPLAFSDHGAEFFAGPGSDARFAVELALANLENRRTPRAYLVALGALAALGDEDARCELADEAAPVAASHPVLQRELDALGETCGR